MSVLLDLIEKHINPSSINSLSQNIGADSEQTKSAIAAALPLLAGALSSKATGTTGLSFLTSLLDKNNDGSVLDDVVGMITGRAADAGSAQATVTAQGVTAVNSMLGEHVETVKQQISQTSGLDIGAVSKLLPLLAPMVLGALTKAQASQNLSGARLSEFLEKERTDIAAKAPESQGFMASLLDKNNDGSIADDVLKMGAGLLGNVLK